ncbi:hypothetical protein EV182_000656 [Spiromyces aspiralis]|uniref:Uncharacterized protein n=1 Tax=Spiromyces aspiralis TaxID=68401 RepID=A0ACC1HGP3_9FUNG|nr:hypothetical protein EV182_000656 [Spiromyces aspiralis]
MPQVTSAYAKYETLSVTSPREHVLLVELNRPKVLNAFSSKLWTELRECFAQIHADSDARCVVLAGMGRMFTAGLDLKDAKDLVEGRDEYRDIARKGYYHRQRILDMQESISAVEKCNKPVIAVVHSGCIGAGIDLITACDIRICSQDAFFVVKEVDIGMAADVGTLQRLPKVVGSESWVRDLALTARRADAKEAERFGLVSVVFSSREEAVAKGLEMAATIASKSPVAITGTKHLLNYSRDHSVGEGLEYTALWNTLMHNTEDLHTAVVAAMTKNSPKFSKL